MSVHDIERMFEEVGVRRWGELVDQGFQSRAIRRAVDEGVIRRPVMRRSLGPVPGILVSAEANGDGMRDAAIAMLLTRDRDGRDRGTVYGQTAAKLLRLADTLPPALDLLIPHERTRLPRQVTFSAKRCRHDRHLDHEVDVHETDLGVPVRITSPARTVADLVHLGRADADAYRHGMTALTRFLATGGETGEILRIVRHLYPDSYDHAAGLADSANEMNASRPRGDDEPEDEARMAP